jgi:hypothetical protein
MVDLAYFDPSPPMKSTTILEKSSMVFSCFELLDNPLAIHAFLCKKIIVVLDWS